MRSSDEWQQHDIRPGQTRSVWITDLLCLLVVVTTLRATRTVTLTRAGSQKIRCLRVTSRKKKPTARHGVTLFPETLSHTHLPSDGSSRNRGKKDYLQLLEMELDRRPSD